jgi:hypothetical protein
MYMEMRRLWARLTAGIGLVALSAGRAAGQTPPGRITITVQPGARQAFRGLGASIFPWTPSAIYRAQVTPAQNREMARLLWHDARLRSARLWIHPGDEPVDFYVDGYVRTGKLPAALAAGATDLILAPDRIPDRMGDTGERKGYIRDAAIPEYAALLAGFIRDFKDRTGILINHCGVLNEPNDRPVKLSDAQWPVMIRALRRALDARGLQAVGIVAPESANCGADAYAVVDAIRADPAAWRVLEGVATHSYNNAATEEMAGRAAGKAYWITEAGGITDRDEDVHDGVQAASAASRFLNDVNHRATHWQFFIGAEQADPNGNTGRILKYGVNPYRLTVLQKYYYLRQLGAAFDVGAVFRHSRSSLDGEMTYTFSHAPAHKPHLNAAAARNPDGTWAVGLSNFTSDAFQAPDSPAWYREQGGYPAQTFAVTVRVPELARTRALRLAVRRSDSVAGDRPAGFVVMRGGAVTLTVHPLELVTLRSAGAGR